MIVCPFCHFENEDGALFCEQCKSDLTGVDSALQFLLLLRPRLFLLLK